MTLVSAVLHIILCSLISAIVLDSMNAADPVVEEPLVCRACQERNVNSVFSTKRALLVHQFRSKNARCQAGGVIKSKSSQGLEILSLAEQLEWDPVLSSSTSHQVLIFVLKTTLSKPGIPCICYSMYINLIYHINLSLQQCVLSDRKGHNLHTFHMVEIESDLYSGIMSACCYPFDVQQHLF